MTIFEFVCSSTVELLLFSELFVFSSSVTEISDEPSLASIGASCFVGMLIEKFKSPILIKFSRISIFCIFSLLNESATLALIKSLEASFGFKSLMVRVVDLGRGVPSISSVPLDKVLSVTSSPLILKLVKSNSIPSLFNCAIETDVTGCSFLLVTVYK